MINLLMDGSHKEDLLFLLGIFISFLLHFPKKNCYPPAEDIDFRSRGVESKINGNPGTMLKIWEKREFPGGWVVNKIK